MNFIEALKVANGVLETYKREQPKWWARMDGTPILNDLAVRMAEAFVAATQAPPAAVVPEGAVISAEGFALIEGLARGDLPSWKMREAGKELDRIRAALAANKENNDAHR